MLSQKQRYFKRGFDVVLAVCGLVLTSIPIILLIVISSIDTLSYGVFTQNRVGKHGKLFRFFKIKTMREFDDKGIIVTRVGRFLRRTKLDELPQLYNVLIGDMSFVGPRPDVQGYADKLKGDDRIILSVKPGITGPATLKYSNEEQLLELHANPLAYNDEVIWPQKIELNKHYVLEWNLFKDIRYIWSTFKQLFR